MKVKNQLLVRVYLTGFVMLLFALIIFCRIACIQLIEGEKWRTKGKDLHVKEREIEANRGNILSVDGSPMASSLMFFDIYMDLHPSVINDEVFKQEVDSLAYCIATYVQRDYTRGAILEKLINARKDTSRYLRIKRNVNFSELERIKSFPIFRRGQMQGGLIIESKNKRVRPHGMLARRTLGYALDSTRRVGLESSCNQYLAGETGLEMVQKVYPNAWIPVNNLEKIEPKSGYDVRTTIDMDFQDIAHEALLSGLKKHNAKEGCAVIMEVSTGEIRAISNLQVFEGKFNERYNHAVGKSTEPGSTFKLASMLALLEDGLVNLTDTIDIQKGKAQFYDQEMVDASFHNLNETSVRRVFELSSNVGMAKLVDEHYNQPKKGKEFIRRLHKMGLGQLTGIEITGEGKHFLKEAYNKKDNWSGTTLPWMSIGYESMSTPLQTLTFYNAVANDGKMMKPMLVKEVLDEQKVIKRFYHSSLNKKIASKKNIKKVQSLLEGVVDSGTAKNINDSTVKLAGKTGTAQIGYGRKNAKKKYQSSFAGYFPADKPKYSCIVVVYEPKGGAFYGSHVAAPIFKEIAEKCYSTQLEFKPAVNEKYKAISANGFPRTQKGYCSDFSKILTNYNLRPPKLENTKWTSVDFENEDVVYQKQEVIKDHIPNVIGMGARDAMYMLENIGLRVKLNGVGKVKKQSIRPGTKAKGQRILIELG